MQVQPASVPRHLLLEEEYQPFAGTREFRALDLDARATLIDIRMSESLVDEEFLAFVGQWLARKGEPGGIAETADSSYYPDERINRDIV